MPLLWCLIWFKIAGCDGKTKCGNRDKIKDKFFGYYKDYIVKYENKKLTIINNDIEQNTILKGKEFSGLLKSEASENNNRSINGKHIIEPLGCGNYITWREMEDVTEYVNEILKNIPNTDYDIKFKEICKKEERKNYENEIIELNSINDI